MVTSATATNSSPPVVSTPVVSAPLVSAGALEIVVSVSSPAAPGAGTSALGSVSLATPPPGDAPTLDPATSASGAQAGTQSPDSLAAVPTSVTAGAPTPPTSPGAGSGSGVALPSPDDAAPSSPELAPLNPAAVPGSGRGPPSPWLVSATSGTVTIAVDGTDLVVTSGGVSTRRPLADVGSLSISSPGGLVVDLSGGAISMPVSYDGGGSGSISVISGTGSAWQWDGGAGQVSGGGIISLAFTGVTKLAAGGPGDTLFGPAADSTWTVTGAGSGTVGGLSFSGFEQLVGAADNRDQFVFEPGGSISGGIDGGPGGFDTLVVDGGAYQAVTYTTTGPNSGTVTRDGDVIEYAGLEPIDDTTVGPDRSFSNGVGGVTITVADSGAAGDGAFTITPSTGESVRFTDAANIKTLTIDAGTGDQTIRYSSIDSTFTGSIVVHADAGNDTFQGSDAGGTWHLTGLDQGTYTATGGPTVTFDEVENLLGGSGTDSYVFDAVGGVIGTIDPGAGPVGVSLGGFVDFSGNLDVTSSTVGVTTVSGSNPGGTQVSGVSMYTFGAPAGTSVFIGADGGTAAATGLQGVSTGDVIGALFVDSATGRVWAAASGALDAAVVGVSGLTLSPSGLSATLNSTASDGTWLDLTKIDLGGGAGYNSTLSIPTGAASDALALTTASASASAAEARVAVGDNVLVQGAFSVTERTVDVDTVAGGAIEDPGATLLDATISGASLFIGAGASFDTVGNTIDTANAVGFSATGLDAELALVKPVAANAGDQTSYLGLQASVSDVSLSSFVGVNVSNAKVEVNLARDATGASSPDRLDWTTALLSNSGTLPSLTMTSSVSSQVGGTISAFTPAGGGSLDLEWSSFGPAGALSQPVVNVVTATVTLAGSSAPVFSATGTFSISSGAVDDPLVGGSAQAFAITLDTSVAGGPVGVAGSLDLISISNSGAGTSWLGVDASGISASLDEAPVTLSLSDGTLKLNRASGSGATKLDWTSFHPTGVALPTLDVGSSLDVELSGKLAVAIADTAVGAGTFTATGTGTLDTGQVTDAAVGGTAQALTLTLDTSADAGGVGSLGSDLTLTSIVNSGAGTSWLGVDASGISASLNEAPVTLTLSDGTLKLNRASGSGATKLDWTSFHPTGLALPALDVSNSLDLELSGKLTVSIAEAGVGSGTITATGTGTLDEGQVTDAASGGQLGGSDAQALALTLDTSVSAGGVGAAGGLLKLVSLTQGAKSWLGVDASGISVSLALEPLTVAVTDGELKLNTAAGTGAAKLDWTMFVPESDSLALPTLAVAASLDLHIAGSVTVGLPGMFTATGTGSLDEGQVTDAASGGQLGGSDAEAVALSLDTSVSAGGVGAAGASLQLVSLTQGSKSWLGVEATGIALSLILDPLTVGVTDGELRLNRATGTGATKLDWTAFVPESDSLTLPSLAINSSLDLHIAGTATVSLAGMFTATGTGSLDEGQVTDAASGGQLGGSDAQAIALSLDTSVSAAGVGAAGASLNLVSLTQGAKSWLGVDASGINLSFTLAPLNVAVTDGELKLNQATGTGATKLDWTAFVPESDGLTLPSLAVSSSLDLHVAGSVTVELPGMFTASGTGSLDEGQVTDAASGGQLGGSDAQAIALSLDTSVSAGGVGAAGASLQLVSLTQGAKSWVGVDASGINLSFALEPLTVSVTDGELKLNRATGTGATKLDWTAFVPESDSLTLPSLAINSSLDLHVAGTATVALAGMFTATGTGSLDEGQVTDAASGGQLGGSDAEAIALALDTSVTAGGVGAAGASLNLVSLTQGSKSWLGVDASGITLSFALDPLTVSVADGELKLNRATGSGATKLDWTAFVPEGDSLILPSLAVSSSLDLHVAGTATVTLAGMFIATGNGQPRRGAGHRRRERRSARRLGRRGDRVDPRHVGQRRRRRRRGRITEARLADPGRQELVGCRRLRDQPLVHARSAHPVAHRRRAEAEPGDRDRRDEARLDGVRPGERQPDAAGTGRQLVARSTRRRHRHRRIGGGLHRDRHGQPRPGPGHGRRERRAARRFRRRGDRADPRHVGHRRRRWRRGRVVEARLADAGLEELAWCRSDGDRAFADPRPADGRRDRRRAEAEPGDRGRRVEARLDGVRPGERQPDAAGARRGLVARSAPGRYRDGDVGGDVHRDWHRVASTRARSPKPRAAASLAAPTARRSRSPSTPRSARAASAPRARR